MDRVKTAMAYGKTFLADHPEALRSAEILLQHTLNVSRTHLYAHTEQVLSEQEATRYQTMLDQRQQGIPIAYITGQRSFWTLELSVTPDTLIPRAETELMIECALTLTDPKRKYRLLDLGTGSGAIALALASERPHWQVTACDLSTQALAIAEQNAQLLQLTSVQFVVSDWLQAFSQQQFDIIVANPPYLADQDPHLQRGDLRFEPHSALISGADGLDALRTIIQHAHQHLTENGILIVEHGYDQGIAVHDLFMQNGYQAIQSWQDGQKHQRVCTGTKSFKL